MKNEKIDVQGTEITIFEKNQIDYLSLKAGINAQTRLKQLNRIAIEQVRVMIENKSLRKLEGRK